MGFTTALGRVTLVCACASLAGACSSDGFIDSIGFGKYSPDETQVRTNQALTLPPDLQLRAPGEGETPQAPAAQAFAPAEPVTTAPPQYGTVDPNQTYDATTQQASQPAQPASQPAQQVAAAPAQPADQTQDVYAKWGISKYRADGTEKTTTELNQELRAASLKQKQAQNPNYGTVFNLPNVWSD